MVVSESYLHFEPRDWRLPRPQIGELVIPLLERATNQFLVEFREPKRAEVVVDEGSIRLRGLIRLTAMALIGYGGIRTGIDYAWRDGKAAAGWVNERVQERLAIPNTDVIARRRGSPAPAQLHRLFENVEFGALSREEAVRRAEKLFRDYGESEETIRVVMNRFTEEIYSAQPITDGPAPRRQTPLQEKQPQPLKTPMRRIRFFRDSTGHIRIVEET